MKIGPKYKIARRLGAGIFDKTQTQKFALSEGRRAKVKGRKKQVSEFGTQLLEKQKIRLTYGVTERQFSNYVKEATSARGASAEMLHELLESRLDNVIYRFGLCPSRQASRQAVSHGHFLVNGKRVDIPSYRVKKGDVISIRERSKKSIMFADLDKKLDKYSYPAWLSFNPGKMEGVIKDRPHKEANTLDYAMVLEFYSR